MTNQQSIDNSYHTAISYLSIIILLLILVTFDKAYPRYLFYMVIGIQIILFIKEKLKTSFSDQKEIIKNT